MVEFVLSVVRPKCGRGGTGRRAGLRSPWPRGRDGSIPFVRTKISRESGVLSLFGICELTSDLRSARPLAYAGGSELCVLCGFA